MSVGTRALTLPVVAAAVALAPAAAAEQPLRRLEGGLHAVVADGLLFEPSDATVGRFALRGAGRRDLRLAPKRLRLRTQGGRIAARATGASVEADEALGVLCEVVPEVIGSACEPAPEPATGPPPGGFTSLNQVITDEQEALLGCGPLYGTVCEVDGLDLVHAEASLLMQSSGLTMMMLPPPPDPDDTSSHPDDAAPPPVVLPGSRDPGSDPTVPAVVTSEAGPLFASEFAAVSFNMQVLAAQLGGPPPDDPSEFDPTDPFAEGRCSWASPEYCEGVAAFLESDRLAPRLPGDPRDGPTPRLWEAGVRYRIAKARGVWRGFRGGTLYAFGPELSRRPDGGSGVALLLEAPAGARPEEPADWLWIGAGPDGVHDTDDDRVFAVLYAAASPCADGIDNDDDGRVDFPRDRDCRHRFDDGETP